MQFRGQFFVFFLNLFTDFYLLIFFFNYFFIIYLFYLLIFFQLLADCGRRS